MNMIQKIYETNEKKEMKRRLIIFRKRLHFNNTFLVWEDLV